MSLIIVRAENDKIEENIGWQVHDKKIGDCKNLRKLSGMEENTYPCCGKKVMKVYCNEIKS